MSKNNDKTKLVSPISVNKLLISQNNLNLFNKEIETQRELNKIKIVDQKQKINFVELQKNKMAEAVEEVLNLYKVEIITKSLPNFDGKKDELFHFINCVDQIDKNCVKINKTQTYQIVLQNVRNKITGAASHSLTTHNVKTTNWQLIRKHLISKYADTRDESNLQFELYMLIKLNLEPQKLYERIQTLLTLLSNQVRLNNEGDEKIIEQLIVQNQNTGLTIFQAGLKEPLGSALRASQPKSLTEALDFVMKEQNIIKLKNAYTSREESKPRFYRNPFKPKNEETQQSEKPKWQNNQKFNKKFYKPTQQTPVIPKSEIKTEKHVMYNLESNIDDEDFYEEALQQTSTS